MLVRVYVIFFGFHFGLSPNHCCITIKVRSSWALQICLLKAAQYKQGIVSTCVKSSIFYFEFLAQCHLFLFCYWQNSTGKFVFESAFLFIHLSRYIQIFVHRVKSSIRKLSSQSTIPFSMQ